MPNDKQISSQTFLSLDQWYLFVIFSVYYIGYGAYLALTTETHYVSLITLFIIGTFIFRSYVIRISALLLFCFAYCTAHFQYLPLSHFLSMHDHAKKNINVNNTIALPLLFNNSNVQQNITAKIDQISCIKEQTMVVLLDKIHVGNHDIFTNKKIYVETDIPLIVGQYYEINMRYYRHAKHQVTIVTNKIVKLSNYHRQTNFWHKTNFLHSLRQMVKKSSQICHNFLLAKLHKYHMQPTKNMMDRNNDNINVMSNISDNSDNIVNNTLDKTNIMPNTSSHYISKPNYTTRLKNILTAIILGDSDNLDEETKALFRSTGTLHLLVISGLHFEVVAGCLGWLSKILTIPIAIWQTKTHHLLVYHKLLQIITSALLFLYCILIGGNISAIRSLSSKIMQIILNRNGRVGDSYALLHLLASCSILFDVTVIFSTSFYLSFITTSAVLYIHRIDKAQEESTIIQQIFAMFSGNFWPILHNIIERMWHKVKYILTDNIRIHFLTSILCAYLFGTYYTYSLFVNTAIIPIFTIFIIPLAAISMLTLFHFVSLNHFTCLLIDLVVQILSFVNNLPNTNIRIHLHYIAVVNVVMIVYTYYTAMKRLHNRVSTH